MAKLSGILVREADRLSALVEDFLRFARPTPPALRRTALNDLTAQVVEMLRCDPLTHKVRLVDDSQPVTHPVDPDQIRQVLLNLIRNACAAVGPGGEVRVGAMSDAGAARVRVWDSGGHISSEDLPLLFEPFFSKRLNGTGLGLSTAHSIVHAHGGTIEVTSSPESGTEFVILLPPGSEEHVDTDRRR
jgi:two-component system sensor histidine kinase PilS (NtrC family)